MANDLSLSTGPRTGTMRPPGGMVAAPTRAIPINPETFLAQAGDGKSVLQCPKHQVLIAQGDAANALFYVQAGLVKLSVVSQQGKEAVVAILERGNFFGEECLAGALEYIATATSLDTSLIVRIERATMKRMLRNKPAFCELVMSHLVTRNVRIQEALVDQLFNFAEKRLARTLLLLAHCGTEGQPKRVIPKISHETLAEMVGTTRSRVSFFLNRFKKLGFIEYLHSNACYQVHSSLRNVVFPS